MGQTSCDDFFSGQAAALAGGTTFHIDFALPVGHDLMAGWEAWKVGAGGRCGSKLLRTLLVYLKAQPKHICTYAPMY